MATEAGEALAWRGAGLNPAGLKHIAAGQDPRLLPLPLGFEVAGVLSAIGPARDRGETATLTAP